MASGGRGGGLAGRGGLVRGKRVSLAASLGLSDHSCQIGVPAVGESYSNIYTNISAAHQSSALAFFTNIGKSGIESRRQS